VITIGDIEAARARLRDAIYVSPCAHSEMFTRASGASRVFLKLENLQMTGSFRPRPARRARGRPDEILSIDHDRAYHGVLLGETAVEITVETRGREHIDELVSRLEQAGYTFERVS
jgi:hypothetical protein